MPNKAFGFSSKFVPVWTSERRLYSVFPTTLTKRRERLRVVGRALGQYFCPSRARYSRLPETMVKTQRLRDFDSA